MPFLSPLPSRGMIFLVTIPTEDAAAAKSIFPSRAPLPLLLPNDAIPDCFHLLQIAFTSSRLLRRDMNSPVHKPVVHISSYNNLFSD